ncbi:MAG: hypothetical protein ACOZCO_09315 [Bacteroidota bacterium]
MGIYLNFKSKFGKKMPIKYFHNYFSVFFAVFFFLSCTSENKTENEEPVLTFRNKRLMDEPVWERITILSKEMQEPEITIELFAEQFRWNVRYPGPDKKLAKSDFRFISAMNVCGVEYADPAAKDDFVAGEEIYLPVGKKIRFQLHSKDVIHCAYFPHFRMQMNAVPGMNTFLEFIPEMTTEEMRKKMKNEKFDYMLLCNKICGAGHHGMVKKVVVVELPQFLNWQDGKRGGQ